MHAMKVSCVTEGAELLPSMMQWSLTKIPAHFLNEFSQNDMGMLQNNGSLRVTFQYMSDIILVYVSI